MKRVIYYFTGTGNSMWAARKIAKQLGDTEIISMRCNPEDVAATDADMIGFVFPVHHWIVPVYAQRFIKRLEMNPNAYVFAISMPGLINGKTFEVLDALLHKKGLRLNYGQKIYSVANYVAMYPVFQNPRKKLPKMRKRLEEIAVEIKKKQDNTYPKANAICNKIWPKIMPKYIANVPHNDSYHHVDRDCISCGLCERICPCKNIKLKNGKPVFLHQCSQCMACISCCPKEAINFPKYTKKRKKYLNPYIRPIDLIKEKEYIK